MDIKTKRAAVFAHYDKNENIEDYVVYYLKCLKNIVGTVIFVSDGKIKEDEKVKISPYADNIIAESHGEYDFGSYKRGYFYLKEKGVLNSVDELIFANDSCYAPLFPFETMFCTMEKSEADFFGNTQNFTDRASNEDKGHRQSYFLVIRKNVFESAAFNDFMSAISKEEDKAAIIDKYEIGLSLALKKAGFTFDSYCATSKIRNNTHSNSYSSLVLCDRSPFLKRGLLLLKPNEFPYPFFIKNLIKKTDYDYSLIQSDIKRNRSRLSLFEYSRFFLKSLFRTIKWRIKKFFILNIP